MPLPSSPRLMDLMLNDQGFVFDPATGETYQLTPTALVCLRSLQAGDSLATMVRKITDQWDGDGAQISSDIDCFLLQIKGLQWI